MNQVSIPEFKLVEGLPAALPTDRAASFTLSPALLEEQGFGHLTITNTDGNITVPEKTRLVAAERGSITLDGANVTIGSNISIPGGSLSFSTHNISPAFAAQYAVENPAGTVPVLEPKEGRGLFRLLPGVTLSTAGLIVDDRPGAVAPLGQPLVIDGGKISIASYSAILANESRINVSGGVAVDTRSVVRYGNGGSISILAGKDPSVAGVIGGELQLGSKLTGYSGATGGSLAIQASTIQIGGTPDDPHTLILQPEFFRKGGFSSYALAGIGAPSDSSTEGDEPTAYVPGIKIAAGVRLAPVVEGWIADLTPDGGATGVSLQRTLNPVGLRNAVSLSFTSIGSDDSFTTGVLEVRGDLVMGSGATIVADPGSKVAFKGQTVTLLGSVFAPGGSISITGANRFPLPQELAQNEIFATPTVHLGAEATLSTVGAAVVIPDAFGRRRGTLYPGGTISITGNILAEAGAILDVSGSSGVFDYHPSVLGLLETPIVPLNSGLTGPLWSLQSVAVPMHSSGGLIDLQGSQMLLSDATLLGMPGGSTATGGTLSVFSGRFYRVGAPQTSADINLVVTQGGKTIASSNQDPGVGIAVLGSDGLPISGMGYFSANRFAVGGFASLDLGSKFIDGGTLSYGGNVEFRGPVSISAAGSLRVAAGGLIQTDSAVKLSGSYVSLGQAFRAPLHPDDPVLPFFTKFDGFATSEHNLSPTFGSGSLTVQAQLIDVGTLVLQNVGRTQLIANGGDIRGNGTLSMAGEITMRAGQVYPTTLGEFNVFAYDAIAGDGSVLQAGTIAVERSGRVSAPISIGGNLRLFASEINQAGVLRAPLGSITLGWDGSDYDLSDADLDTPLDPIAKSTAAVPIADRVTLRSGSMTSVSSIGVVAPFGLSPDGTTWIDPRGVNVTVGGLPEKRVVVSGDNVVKKAGSTIDLRGGGDLLAFRWVPGSGGSVDILGTATATWSTDAQYSAGDLVTFGGRTWSARVSHSGRQPTPSLYWTLVPESYAVVPGYQARFAPYAPFNTGSNADFLGGDPGFIGGTLKIGDQIYLDGMPGLDGGVYTLLPRRYALLPGAFLVTPKSGMPLGTLSLPDGSSYSSGFAFNQFSLPGQFAELQARYEVAPYDVLRERGGYDNYLGNAFFTEAASRLRVKRPQALPMDSGYFGMHGNSAISIGGKVLTGHPYPGNGATIDLSSFGAIAVVGGSGTGPTGAAAVLKTSILNSWNADSLIVGGLRRETANGTVVDVRTNSLVLDNPGSKLTGPDITLASAGDLTVTDGSSVKSTGSLSGRAVPLTIAGDGALLRVSADSRASVNRSNLSSATDPLLTIGADVQIGGRSVILDSTYGTSVDPTVGLNTKALTLGSGQISIILDGTAPELTGSMVDPHLVLAGDLLADVQQVRSVTLSSYRTIDLYGAGELGSETLRKLSLFASGLRGYNQGEGMALIRVDSVTLANPSNVAAVAQPGSISGTLQFEASTLRLGSNTFSASGYEGVNVNAAGGILGQSNDGVKGTFSTPGDLTITAPVITGLRGSTHEIVAGGNLVLQADEGASAVQGGLGASFAFTGSTVVADGNVLLPSGQISLRALTGDLTVGGTLDVSGTRRDFYDLIRFTDAGSISLTSDLGNVTLLPAGRVSAEGAEGGGNAGTVAVKASNGAFILNNSTLLGSAGNGERAGTFTLDAGSLTSFADLADALNDGGFFEERNLRVRSGDITIDGTTTARKFFVSADIGDIRVTGSVNASGRTGGKIALMAGGDLLLEAGSELNVHAREFSSAGKGGEIRLEAGAAVNGIANQNAMLDLQMGAMLDLGVDAFKAGDYTTVGSSAFRGQFTGTLHLRAPRTSGNTDVAVNTIGATIANASSILVEGYEIVDLTSAGGLITGGRTNGTSLPGANTVQGAVYASASAFLSTANHDAMMARLLGGDSQGLAGNLVLAPGVEIINTNGDLTIGAPNSTSLAGDWSLADFRFGPKGSPGVLTLRASGDVVFNNALSDGFAHVNPTDANGRSMLWLGQLLPIDTDLPINTQSWSFRIAAGSDLGAADFRAVLRTEQLAPDKGSIIVGEYYASVPNSTTSGANAGVGSNGLTANSIRIGSTGTRYEVIRTGTGDIDMNAGRNLQLSNQFATVYTAGVRLPDPTNVYGTNDFVLPIVSRTPAFPNQGGLGAYQQLYPAQWSMAGGDVSLAAQGDIGRFTRVNGEIVPDSSLQLPNNWLNRRGFLDPLTGLFAAAGVNDPPISSQRVDDLSASTAWWVDFSNFFEGFGALGGGDVTLLAGHDLVNADAAIATNARMSGRNAIGENIAPDPARLLELGGGDLVARAGNNIDAGVYYVERGSGELSAGGSIETNETRSPSVGGLTGAAPLDPLTWLPTTLFVGKSQFEVSARGDVLIGPIANTFLLPQGLNNKFWYKTYFNTFSGDAGASISSFGGSVTHRLAVTLDGGSLAQPILGAWLKNVNQFTGSTSNASYYQPWIRLAELSLDREGYDPVFALTVPTIESTAFAGDVNIVGAMTLFPSSKGTLELAASGNVIGLNPTGQGFSGDTTPATVWTSTTISISDANPAMVPNVISPLAYSSFVGLSLNASRASNVDLYQSVSQMFRETGSYTGVNGAFDVQQALHSPGPLHSGDPNPVKVYAASGDVTGLTLFSPKATQIIANNDITDISFYIQNVAPTDISIVSAGRDIIPFNENASVRTLASDLGQGNTVGDAQRPTVAGTSTNAAAGDIQINGPGVIEILAGRNLDLGTGSNFTDGTGVGITSVGNSRNPYLPFEGADIIAMAGVSGSEGRGPAIGLSGSSLDFSEFIEEYLANGPESPSSYLRRLGRGFEFEELNDEQQAIVALESFYEILRDAGRFAGANPDPASTDSGSGESEVTSTEPASNAAAAGTTSGYDDGFAAIETLFGTDKPAGEIDTRARDVRTVTGGAISLASVGGGLTMASDIFGNPLTPPGIVTEYGGTISSFTDGSVSIGQARIFTLRGGDINIWSSNGDIAAGNAPKTVVTAPPTRVIVDADSGAVETDLGGLATGGGIGVLASVEGVPPGNVDLIAPNGAVDAGDAGIRASGNLNIAATTVLNAGNIQVAGSSSGVPAPAPVAAPNLGALTAGSSTAGAAAAAATQMAQATKEEEDEEKEKESIVVVEVIGYGGGEG
ncbi:MAG TPA: filamentous hemagglutinin family protein [Chthoniobacteraceae bacterium]|nr:filamentous hemagglutinin family protein [Chthoniobacteraceae bacterium]